MKNNYSHLSTEERAMIMSEHQKGSCVRAIAERFGRSASTISRELNRDMAAARDDALRRGTTGEACKYWGGRWDSNPRQQESQFCVDFHTNQWFTGNFWKMTVSETVVEWAPLFASSNNLEPRS